MPPRKQTEYGFAEARAAAVADLSILIDYAKSLGDATKKSAPYAWVGILDGLRAKVQTATGNTLSEREIKRLWDFAQVLVQGFPEMLLQMSQFWSLHEEIRARLQGTEKGYWPDEELKDLEDRIRAADEFARDVVGEAQKLGRGLLSIAALLLVHAARTETIEYAFLEQLTQALERFKLSAGYDPFEILSVDQKVPKKDQSGNVEWRTDVRAIRDAIAHFRFKIGPNRDGEWSIRFENHASGYDYERTFTSREFTTFFDRHTILYKNQFMLLKIWMLLPLLATHFWNKQQ